MRYPEALVNEYGAKAGVLMYVAQECPDIPQAPMVVSRKDEPTKDFLARIGKPKFEPPWLVRSSTPAELEGYEGELDTRPASSTYHLKDVVDMVRSSPKELKRKGVGLELPNEINAIIAKETESKYIGTYIKHPNIPDFYLMSLTQAEKHPFWGAIRFAYSYNPSEGSTFLRRFTNSIGAGGRPILGEEISAIMSWHDRIASLPQMDPNWAYQVEFGLYPTYLFQVRPFKPYEYADFEVPEDVWFKDSIKPIVIGITPPEGILARVRQLRYNFAFEMFENLPADGEPVVAIDDLRGADLARRLPNHQANLFGAAFGFLEHKDVAAMRRAKVTALYSGSPDVHGRSKQGDWLIIISNGRNIFVKNVNEELNLK